MFSKEDIRTMGSGNAGTTNVLRSVGKRAAILTFVFDILKCVISVLLAKYILEYICAASNAPFYSKLRHLFGWILLLYWSHVSNLFQI